MRITATPWIGQLGGGRAGPYCQRQDRGGDQRCDRALRADDQLPRRAQHDVGDGG